MLYFDNAATTFPKPERVYKAMDFCARNGAVNVGRGQYPLAENASILVNKTREKVKQFFNAKDNSFVIFTSSATIAINQILRGIDYSSIRNVYISPFEHNAVIRTLNYLNQKYNFCIRQLQVDFLPFSFNLNKIEDQFIENEPDLVVLSHASNVCGSVLPAKDIFTIAKKYNAITVLDSAQSAGLIEIFYSSWNIDYLIFAGHKALLGPFGVAGFIMNENMHLKPILSGGTGFDSQNPFMPQELPFVNEAGSLNLIAIVGLGSAIDYINEIGIKNIHKKEIDLRNHFINLINDFDEFEIIGKNYQGEYVGVISVIHENYSPDEIGKILGGHNICVRTGLQCSPLAHKFFGTFPSGTIRFSFSFFNNIEEINSLEILKEIL
ncbi:MAG: aminotransferase class V-fold PLP-dependent enzyme [Sphaerochaetaceae bacterium]